MVANDAFSFISSVADYVLYILGGIMTWLYRSVSKKFTDQSKSMDDLRNDHNTFKLHVANEYVKNTAIERIENKLDKLYSFLINGRES